MDQDSTEGAAPRPYRDTRQEQSRGVTLSGQRSLAQQSDRRSARNDGDCQHRGGRELGCAGMANGREPLLNAVKINEPKMLTGSNQKGTWLGAGRVPYPVRRRDSHRRTGGASPSVVLPRNVVTPYPSRQGQQPARGAYGGAGTGGGSKRRPGGNGRDRECAVAATSSHAQASRLPSGLSARERLTNRSRRQSR